ADPLAQGLVDAVPGAVVAPASVPGVDRGPGREVVRQQAPLAASADQVEDGVEHLAQFGRRPAGALGPGEERLDEGELVIGQVSVITLGSHNPFYGSEPGFRTGSKCSDSRLGNRNILFNGAGACSDRTHDGSVQNDGHSAAENDDLSRVALLDAEERLSRLRESRELRGPFIEDSGCGRLVDGEVDAADE